MNSLQFKLSVWLTAGVLLLLTGACSLSFFRVYHEATELFDEELWQVAELLNRHGMPIPQDTELDRQFINARTGIVVQKLGEGGALSLLELDNPSLGYHSLNIGGEKWRLLVTASRDGENFVVAQRFFLRDKIAWESTAATFVPLLLFMGLAVVGACLVVRHVFRPVRRLTAELDARKRAQELVPLSDGNIPSELQPFVEAINRMLARVAKSVEVQRRFVADAAHELRTPLTALSLQAERLEAAEMSFLARERLLRLRRGLNRARSLINQLLTLARAQGPQREKSEELSLEEMFRRTLEDLIPLAEERSVDLGVTSREDVLVMAPPHAVAAVLRNLVDNAIRYTPAGGRVDLYAGYEEGCPVLTVSDTGPGIAEEEAARVFEPFYRCGGTTPAGSGLGLSIVKTLTESWGGSVRLEDLGRDGRTGLRVRVSFRA